MREQHGTRQENALYAGWRRGLWLGAAPRLAAMLWLMFVTAAWGQQALETDGTDRDYTEELVRRRPLSPQESLRAFEVDPGMRVELVAHEPQIADPIAIAFDPLGRLYVVEMRGYSEQPDENRGRVRRLTDRDGDGYYESATDFLTDLSWPTAIACFDGGILLGHPPHLQFCKDTSGDGRADVIETWASGFGRQNVQGMLNSFVWGLDGRLYGSTSSNGGTLSGSVVAGTLSLRRQDFALDVVRRQLVAVSGGGQHGMSFDRSGDRFVSSNSNHLQWVEFEQQYERRNPHHRRRPATRSIAEDGPAAEVYRASPVEPWREVRTRLRVKGLVGGPIEGGGRAAGYFTGATGVTIYRGDALPLGDVVHAFIGDVGGNLVHHKVLRDEGLSKTARRVRANSEFLASKDTWFRPCQFANGPDGALYVVDMYRETIEHPLSLPPVIKRHLDLTSGNDRGRIYRVLPAGAPRIRRPVPGEVDDAQLVQMLGHPNGWHRETAMQLLLTPPALKQAKWQPLLEQLIENASHPQAKVRALACLEARGTLPNPLLVRCLGDASALVRKYSLRLAEKRPQAAAVRDAALACARDSDVHVRYQLALSLGAFPQGLRVEPLLALARRDGEDAKMRHALSSSLAGIWSQVATALCRVEPANPFCSETIRQAAASGESLVGLVRAIHAVPAGQRSDLLAALFAGVGARDASLVGQLQQRGVSGAESLVKQFLQGARSRARSGTGAASRRQAVSWLSYGSFAASRALWPELLALRQERGLRETAVEVLLRYDDERACVVLLDHLESLPAAAQRTVLSQVCAHATWAERLLDRLELATLPAALLGPQHRRQLTDRGTAEQRKRARALFGSLASRSEVVERYQSVLAEQGDPGRGQQLFGRLCASCHRRGELGHPVGPDLAPLRNRGAAYFLTNILDPNREVDARYVAYVAVDESGKETTGIVVQEDAGSIELLGAEAKRMRVRREALLAYRSLGTSLMPEGFEKDLSPEQTADLIAYLVSE